MLAHLRADLVNRRGHHAREPGQPHSQAVGQGQHARHVDAKRLDHDRVFRGRAQVGAELGALDHEPCGQADHNRGEQHPDPVVGQEDEIESDPATQAVGQFVRPSGRTEPDVEHAFDHQRQAQGQQHPISVVDVVDLAYEQLLHQDADRADDQRHDDQRRPVPDRRQVQHRK